MTRKKFPRVLDLWAETPRDSCKQASRGGGGEEMALVHVCLRMLQDG